MQPRPARPQRSTRAIVLEFLGSMNLAITLLVAVAIAAIIGTVLQQGQPYPDYVIKFGPFWFEVFKALGLFNIYSAPWFMALVGFLLVSTSVCVYRQGPGVLRDMRHFRLDVQEKSLRGFHHVDEWQAEIGRDEALRRVEQRVSARGYRTRQKTFEGGTMLAGMKGASGRLGYLLSHVAIVVICLGALIDGNFPLKLKEYLGIIKVETEELPISEIPKESILPVDNLSFRGNISIPEGSSRDYALLFVRDGYLLQPLPFRIELKDFRVEHYPSGQPKSFESDVIIHDDTLPEPLHKTISVNHPLVHRGYAIYQSGFSDGGSGLELKAWWFDAPQVQPLEMDARVGQGLNMGTPQGERTLELTDFKLYNIFPADENDPSGRKFRNYGPSVIFKVRESSGEAREYVNYMTPVTLDGRNYYLSGVRETPAEDYRFLHIPLDPAGSLNRFMEFRRLALDTDRIRAIAQRQAAITFAGAESAITSEELVASMTQLVETFNQEGIEAIVAQVEKTLAEEKRQEALGFYIRVIQNILGDLYVELLKEEGVEIQQGVSEADARFFDDAMNAFSLLGPYGSPFYLQLTDFEHVEASGLQIARAPAQSIVYLGFVMLMAGVFFMFYVQHRRVWVKIEDKDGALHVLMAGTSHRGRGDYGTEFESLRNEMRAVTTTADMPEKAAGNEDKQ